jgi:hypothetical protein
MVQQMLAAKHPSPVLSQEAEKLVLPEGEQHGLARNGDLTPARIDGQAAQVQDLLPGRPQFAVQAAPYPQRKLMRLWRHDHKIVQADIADQGAQRAVRKEAYELAPGFPRDLATECGRAGEAEIDEHQIRPGIVSQAVRETITGLRAHPEAFKLGPYTQILNAPASHQEDGGRAAFHRLTTGRKVNQHS